MRRERGKLGKNEAREREREKSETIFFCATFPLPRTTRFAALSLFVELTACILIVCIVLDRERGL